MRKDFLFAKNLRVGEGVGLYSLVLPIHTHSKTFLLGFVMIVNRIKTQFL
jgi:hypothetical protein